MAANGERPDGPFLYDAFISYRHVDRDREWAEWLIAALEHYHVPKTLQDKGFPPRLRKIFRDEDEVPASADLNDQIKQALTASRFLIVVCSAFTPRSKWVEREIEIFNELGRGDQVLALLTEGEPGDSFPAAMLVRRREVIGPGGAKQIVTEDKEPLAADVRPRPGVPANKLKQTALLRLVAVILGVKFDDLYQREREWERKRLRAWAALAAAALLLVAGGALGYWQTIRPKAAHFSEIVFRGEVPEGLDPIDEETRARRAANYRVITQRGKVVEVRHENSAGSLLQGAPWGAIARWVVRYRGDGSLERIEMFDDLNRLSHEELYERDPLTSRLIVNFKRGANPLAQEAVLRGLDFDDDYLRDGSGGSSDITRNELAFDEDGFVVERRYQDHFGTPKQDAHGSFGQRYARSASGLLTRSAEIGPDGSEITLKTGVRATTNAYDRTQRLVRSTTLGADDKPLNGVDGLAYWVAEYDSAGNGVSTRYFGADSRPILPKAGCAQVTYVYDTRGNVIESACFGIDDKPIRDKNGSARSVYTRDERGYAIETLAYGTEGKLEPQNDGCARVVSAYDNNGAEIRKACFDADGKPTFNKEGYASAAWTFNASGKETAAAYFDADGKPILDKSGCAKWVYGYDARGNFTESICLGADDKPALPEDGAAKVVISYDPRGNPVETRFFDADGKTTLSKAGSAIYQRKFDNFGNRTEVSFFGVDGKPMLQEGAARITYRFDRGREVERQVFDVDGNPTLSIYGYAGYRQEFNERGLKTAIAFFGPDGKPTVNGEGFARIAYSYDQRDFETERAIFGVDGQRTYGSDGYSSVRFEYNERGLMVAAAYFGVDGKPIVNRHGTARTTWVYDTRGKEAEVANFGADGKPALIKGYAKISRAFDARGNKIEEAFFGIDGRPATDPDGVAKYKLLYDSRDKEIERRFFGSDGKPKLVLTGYAGIRSTFDDHNRLVAETSLGIDGKPIPIDGVAKYAYGYDDRGYRTKVAYLDIDDKPAPNPNGVAQETSVYDARGNQLQESFYGADGLRALGKDGYAEIHRVFDPRGKLTETSYFGVDGKPLLVDGVAKFTYAYDARGYQTDWAYFGADGKPVSNGYARIKAVNNARGQKLEETYLGPDGLPTPTSNGVARIVYTYDDWGREFTAKYFDARGREIALDVVIAAVGNNGLAQRAGLMRGDRIASYAGRKITSTNQLAVLVTDLRLGEVRVLVARRGSQELSFELPPGRIGVNIELTPGEPPAIAGKH